MTPKCTFKIIVEHPAEDFVFHGVSDKLVLISINKHPNGLVFGFTGIGPYGIEMMDPTMFYLLSQAVLTETEKHVTGTVKDSVTLALRVLKNPLRKHT